MWPYPQRPTPYPSKHAYTQTDAHVAKKYCEGDAHIDG